MTKTYKLKKHITEATLARDGYSRTTIAAVLTKARFHDYPSEPNYVKAMIDGYHMYSMPKSYFDSTGSLTLLCPSPSVAVPT